MRLHVADAHLSVDVPELYGALRVAHGEHVAFVLDPGGRGYVVVGRARCAVVHGHELCYVAATCVPQVHFFVQRHRQVIIGRPIKQV